MSTLAHELDRYLAIRRSLGFDLGTAARVLRRFVAFAHSKGVDHVTTELFLGWKDAFGGSGLADLGSSPGDGPPVCPMAERDRSEKRSAAESARSGPTSPFPSVYL